MPGSFVPACEVPCQFPDSAMRFFAQILNRVRRSVQAIPQVVNAKAEFMHYAGEVAEFCCTDSENTAAISFSSTVRIRRPKAQIPAVTFHSTRLGAYSTTSWRVDGIKPGMIRPMPFSIQMPTIHRTHAAIRTEPRSRVAGLKNSAVPSEPDYRNTRLRGRHQLSRFAASVVAA